MKVLVTGVKGQLGYDVMNELAKRGYEGVGVDVAEMDITDSAAVEKVMTEVHPDKVVHCAAWTAVDAAEDNQEVCHRVISLLSQNNPFPFDFFIHTFSRTFLFSRQIL